MTLTWTKLRSSTIALLLLVATGSAAVQVAAVKAYVIPLLANHPHFSTLGGGLLIMIALLHEPVVVKVIQSLSQQETVTAPDGSVKVSTVTAEVTQTPGTSVDVPAVKAAEPEVVEAIMKNVAGKVIAALLCLALCVSMTGCNGQQTAAALVSAVGNAVASLEAVEGNTALVAKVQKDTAVASQDVLNWKSGTPAQDVIAALNLVEDDLQLLPVPPGDVALVDLAKAPKDAKAFKAQWNALVVASGKPGAVAIK